MVNSSCIACIATSRSLLATVAAVVIGVVIAMAITHGLGWKVSLHPGGIAGSVSVLVLLLGPILLVLTPLVALVGWACWRVGAQMVVQALVATVLIVVITVSTLHFEEIALLLQKH